MGKKMRLRDTQTGHAYTVTGMSLPEDLERRLQALGLTCGTKILVMNKKRHGAMIVKIRGTRFAIGRMLAENIETGEESVNE